MRNFRLSLALGFARFSTSLLLTICRASATATDFLTFAAQTIFLKEKQLVDLPSQFEQLFRILLFGSQLAELLPAILVFAHVRPLRQLCQMLDEPSVQN